MLISCSVSNYRSFHEKQTFSLVANGRYTDHPDHLREIPGEEEKLLPVIALYGANAAGKSNLVKALQVLRNVIGTDQPLPANTFMTEGGISEIEVQIMVEQRIYIYGLAWERNLVRQEWLLERKASRTITLFERLTTETGEVTVALGSVEQPSAKLKAMVTIGAQPSLPFLRVVHRNLNKVDRGEQIDAIIEWIKRLLLIFPGSRRHSLVSTLADDVNFREFVSQFLATAATGIQALRIEEQKVSEDEVREMGFDVEYWAETVESGSAHFLELPGREATLRLSHANTRQYHLMTLQAAHAHKHGLMHLPIEDESDGTRQLLHLLPALFHIRTSPVIIIDEIDRSLHPQLSKHLIRQFLKLGGQQQLIFTTHDLNFMDLGLLRRDEIWFAEKKDGATELYSLADFKVRKDLNIDKAYLEGRFGAVPPVEQAWPAWVEAIRKELEPQKATE